MNYSSHCTTLGSGARTMRRICCFGRMPSPFLTMLLLQAARRRAMAAAFASNIASSAAAQQLHVIHCCCAIQMRSYHCRNAPALQIVPRYHGSTRRKVLCTRATADTFFWCILSHVMMQYCCRFERKSCTSSAVLVNG